MERTLARETSQKIGQEVLLKGWVNVKRDHGKLVFVDLRDRTGLVQVVFAGMEEARQLRPEWVIAIKGIVKKRPENLINPKLATGNVEIEVKEFQ
ncbi:MAG: OB-fold nucleic acid binding domain-containing protein, partial [Patescibacteria group bacterium]